MAAATRGSPYLEARLDDVKGVRDHAAREACGDARDRVARQADARPELWLLPLGARRRGRWGVVWRRLVRCHALFFCGAVA